MTMKLIALAAGALMVSAGAASAAPGRTTTDLHLRNGPGTGYGVITTMPEGARVNIRNCTGSWCRVNFRGTSGWAAANLLSGGGSTYAYSRGYDRGYGGDGGGYVEQPSTGYGYGNGAGYGYDGDYGYGSDLGYAYEPGIDIGVGFGSGWDGGYGGGWRRW